MAYSIDLKSRNTWTKQVASSIVFTSLFPRFCTGFEHETPAEHRSTGTLWQKIQEILSGGIRIRIPRKLDVVAFSLGISMPWLFVFWKMSWNHDLMGYCLRFSMSRFFGLGISMLWLFCLGISMSCICASTGSFSFSLNLLCHIINVNMWVVNWCKLFCIS